MLIKSCEILHPRFASKGRTSEQTNRKKQSGNFENDKNFGNK